jgi:uncharacterized damage-inducible protein DinB
MKLAEIRTLFDYDAWATERILTQAAKLTPEQFATNPGASKSSVRQLLAHTLIAQLLWRTRFETGTSNIDTKADDALTAGTLRQWWARRCAPTWTPSPTTTSTGPSDSSDGARRRS